MLNTSKKNKNIAKEIKSLTLAIIGILYIIALASYTDLESPFSTGITSNPQNYLGIVGAYIADISFWLIGMSSYILAISLIWIAINIHNNVMHSINTWIFVIKFILFLLMIITSSALFDNIISQNAGGLLGLEVNHKLKPMLGNGIIIIYIALAMLIFSIISNFSLIDSFNKIIFVIYITIKTIFQTLLKLINISKNIKKNRKITQPNTSKSLIKTPTIKKNIKINSTNKNKDTDCLLSTNLLDKNKINVNGYSTQDLQHISSQVIEKLKDFGFDVSITAVNPGPVITQFELSLTAGTKVNQIINLSKDLARALLVESVRIIDVIPGKPVIGLEIPNAHREFINLKKIITSNAFINSQAPLTMGIGKNINGENFTIDLAKAPHLLVAGATGMGKSVGLNAMILSILFKSTPKNVRMIMIDPKVVELAIYADIPHLLTPVVTDMNKASSSLFWCVNEMERRYSLLAKFGVRNIDGFNQKIKIAKKNKKPILNTDFDNKLANDEPPEELEELPLIVIIIDEYADMLGALAQEDRTKSKRTESFIIRLAQKARAAGIHLIIATQRPSVDVITGLIKSNIPTRIAFKVASKIDSRTILDASGAEQLLGMGDMLYMSTGTPLMRLHGAFVSDDEIIRVVNFLKSNYNTNYINDITANIETKSDESYDVNSTSELDNLYDEAVQIVTSTRKASISSLQRRLRIGYNRAARIIEDMESAKIVSPMNSAGNREVLAPEPIE